MLLSVVRSISPLSTTRKLGMNKTNYDSSNYLPGKNCFLKRVRATATFRSFRGAFENHDHWQWMRGTTGTGDLKANCILTARNAARAAAVLCKGMARLGWSLDPGATGSSVPLVGKSAKNRQNTVQTPMGGVVGRPQTNKKM